MKFANKNKPKHWSRKIVKKFAWIPIKSNTHTHWLEFVYVEYVFKPVKYRSLSGINYDDRWVRDKVYGCEKRTTTPWCEDNDR